MCKGTQLHGDVAIQSIVSERESSQAKEASQFRWDMTVKRIVGKIERVEKQQIAEWRRDGPLQIHGSEVEHDHSVKWLEVGAGNRSPVAQGDGWTPIGHWLMRIACDQRLELK